MVCFLPFKNEIFIIAYNYLGGLHHTFWLIQLARQQISKQKVVLKENKNKTQMNKQQVDREI